MDDKITIRETRAPDRAQILELYPDAFPDEDLTPLVAELLTLEQDILSLGGFTGDRLVAHVLFTTCRTENDPAPGALLGPLAVSSDLQRQGIGTRLVNAGISKLETLGHLQVYVLGDPQYYSRFGFLAEDRVSTPYPIPTEWAPAWQSLHINRNQTKASGVLRLPDPWMNPALWG